MWHDIVSVCRDYPQIPIFLALAMGYLIGKIKIFGFSLGSTASVLLSALIIGQMNIEVSPVLKAIAFALFIFCMGYKVGPQFFGAIKKGGLKFIWLSLFVAIVGLATAITLGKAFGFDKGTTAGLLAGAMTQSSVIGTADGAIKHLSVSAAEKATLETNVAIAYAISYIFGVAGLIIFFKTVPRLMGLDLKKEARKLEEEMSGGQINDIKSSSELFAWNERLILRAYRVAENDVMGKTVSELEDMFPDRISAARIKRDNKVFDAKPNEVIQSGDIVAIVSSHRDQFLKAEQIIGPEVDDEDVVGLVGEVMEICVLANEVEGKTVGELAADKRSRGCYLKGITRQGHDLPVTMKTVVHKCDVMEIAGTRENVEKVAKMVGYPERPTAATDLILVGLGCVFGTLLGLVMVKIGGVPITLGVGGGVLVAGLICGWLRSVRPTFGQIPTGAQWIFTDFGLNLFIACVGFVAGPRAVHALQTTGGALFFAGVMLTLTPHIFGVFFGKYVLRMNPILLFGALTGAGTATPSLNALKEESESSMPVLGYTVPFAFGNVILTVWGTVIVNVM